MQINDHSLLCFALLCFVFDLQAPSAGRVKVLCSGPPGRKPGESCWAMDGPSRRAHGAEPERGNLSAAKAERWGKAFLVPFGAVCQKGPAVRAEPIERRGASNGYAPKPTKRSKDQKIAACGSAYSPLHLMRCQPMLMSVSTGRQRQRQLRAVIHMGQAQYLRHIQLDGVFRDAQIAGNLVVGLAFTD